MFSPTKFVLPHNPFPSHIAHTVSPYGIFKPSHRAIESPVEHRFWEGFTVEVGLSVVELNQAPEFEALSSVWESPGDPVDTLCDNEVVSVTQNLHGRPWVYVRTVRGKYHQGRRRNQSSRTEKLGYPQGLSDAKPHISFWRSRRHWTRFQVRPSIPYTKFGRVNINQLALYAKFCRLSLFGKE